MRSLRQLLYQKGISLESKIKHIVEKPSRATQGIIWTVAFRHGKPTSSKTKK